MTLAQAPLSEAVLSADRADLDCPGVMIEFDPNTAELWGAFLETALDERTAWEANGDLDWH